MNLDDEVRKNQTSDVITQNVLHKITSQFCNIH